MIVPFFNATRSVQVLERKIHECVKRVLASGRFVLGEEGVAFEKEFASYLGVSYAVGVNSGTDALKIALRAQGIGEGDEVITVSNTAVPTVSAIREIGATPRFVDTDEYFLMDTHKLGAAVTPKTKAIVPVHLYGQPADMEAIMRVAEKHNLHVVEDCAQSAGASIGNRKTGTFADAAAWSFYPTKNLGGCGDGGLVTTNDKRAANTAQSLRMYGMEDTYDAKREGWNSRLDELQAALLRTKLPHLTEYNERRRAIARRYLSEITNPVVTLPSLRRGATHVFHLFVVRVKERERFTAHLKKNGIGFGIHYPIPIHLQDAYRFLGYAEGALPNTETAAREVVSLPIFPELTDAETEAVIRTVTDFDGTSSLQ